MKQSIKFLIIKLLALWNYFPTPATDKNKINELIKSLQPITTDKELIRLGPEKDGGYLVPNDLDAIEACFSPGVNTVCGFERDCADMGIEVFMADNSIEKIPDTHTMYNFVKKFIGSTSNNEFFTMDDWVATAPISEDSDLMLQMDIEGYEYETFLSMSDKLLSRFRIIVVEFHSLQMLFSQPFFSISSSVFEKILQTHEVVHIHPNNAGNITSKNGLSIPAYLEITFLRKDRIKNKTFTRNFPHHLDRDCSSAQKITLPQCWYKY